MKNKFKLILFFGIFLFFIFISTSIISSEVQVLVCAEETTDGTYCQHVTRDKIKEGSRFEPTSCEQTSFCQLGTCLDGDEGVCRPNIAKSICENSGFRWDERKENEIRACDLGCCYIGNTASFVTETRCNVISNMKGQNIIFDPSIRSQESCVRSIIDSEIGACISDNGFKRDCEILTGMECNKKEESSREDIIVEFFPNFLCSAPILETICDKSLRTTCVENKDEVYFLDTCGNIANIYDWNKRNDDFYWSEIQRKSESCSLNNENLDICGSCTYSEGSVCRLYSERDYLTNVRPKEGNFICASLDCEYNGISYRHGESWCGNEEDFPGNQHYTLTCLFGEVFPTLCDAFRNKVCVEENIMGVTENDVDIYRFATCKTNLWNDCLRHKNEEDCSDIELGDCEWHEESNYKLGMIFEEILGKEPPGICLPKYSPGLNWYSGSESSLTCQIGNKKCLVKFEKTLLQTNWRCKENCECAGLNKNDQPFSEQKDSKRERYDKLVDWVEKSNKICASLGDCGYSTNYIGKDGFFNLKDMYVVTARFEGED